MLILLSLLIILGSYPVLKMHTDSNGEGWLPKNSKKLELRNQFLKDFGSDELMMLYLTFPDSSSRDYKLEMLGRISDSVSNCIYGFESVFSRYNILKIEEVMGAKYAQRMEQSYFSARDTSGEMLFLKVRANKDIITVRPLIIDSLYKELNRILPKEVKIKLSGQSIVFNEINRLSSEDSKKLFIICFILIFILLWWQLKKIKYLLICISLVILALLPSVSLFGWFDIPFNMITMTVPLLFVINFSSFVIHIITKQSTDIERYIHKKIPPIISSAVVTIIGFGSLSVSNIKLISQFGILTSMGIITGLIILLFIGVPLTIKFIEVNERVTNGGRLNRFLDSYYSKITSRVSYFILFISLMLIGAGVFVFQKIDNDTNMIDLMKPDNEVRKTIQYIEDHYGAANVVDFLITKADGKPIDNSDIKKIAGVNKNLMQLSFVKNVVGYDMWRPMVNAISAAEPIIAGQITRNFISEDKTRSRLIVNIPSGSVKEMDAMLTAIQKNMNTTLQNSNLKIEPAGFLPLYVEQMNTIVDGMLYGLAIALVLILLVIIIWVRDIKLGLITIFVTILPLTGLAILMKILNISFDVGTSIISSVAIGMITDDALHIVWNYKRHMKRQGSNEISDNQLFAESVRKIIYPCTITSVMFSIGFAVLIYSNMITIANFGLLSAATIIFAWISDFIFLPALLKMLYKR